MSIALERPDGEAFASEGFGDFPAAALEADVVLAGRHAAHCLVLRIVRLRQLGRHRVSRPGAVSPRCRERQGAPEALRDCSPSMKSTSAPLRTIAASASASQFVSLMQPCDEVFEIWLGSGVPWMP